MTQATSALARAIKTSCFSRGVRVTPRAEEVLTHGGKVPLSIHEYATTGGVTFVMDGRVFVNAPFDEPFCADAEVALDVGEDGEGFEVSYGRERLPVEVLPLPGYLGVLGEDGRPVSDVVMSHADRARVSPVGGCSFSCGFCDLAGKRYSRRPAASLLHALRVAMDDKNLPVRHVLVSGGTPLPGDQAWFEESCASVARGARVPVDVMMTPRADLSFVDALVDAGVHGFAINLEVYGEGPSRSYAPQKAKLGHGIFGAAIARAVERTGGRGRVRSLLIAGLEPASSTLEGVEFLARLGCDPALSPFRPARGTALSHLPPPTAGFLDDLYARARDVAESYGVKLGPRCIPCQHNTLTFPDGAGYHFS